MQASVKVMRSHDYCHFEVALTSECGSIDDVNDLRKQAAILVDEAVRQYKIAKTKESNRAGTEYQVQSLLKRIDEIKATPQSEWTPEEAAIVRGAADREFWREHEEESYCYGDPERDYHFSMLRRFKETRISGANVSA